MPTQPAVELAIVIPTFNEADNVRGMLLCLADALAGIPYEVVFVDDDSPDGTAEIVRQLARENARVRIIQRVNRRGLASASIEGMLSTSAPFLALMDADLQHDEHILPEMLRVLKEENLDVVVGSRNVSGGSMGKFPAWRVALSTVGRRLSSLVCRCEVQDPMSGFFVLRRTFLMEAVHRVSGVGFKILVDLLASAGRKPRLREIPYTFRDRLHGESKLDVLVGIEYFQLLLDKTFGDWIPPAFVLFASIGGVGVGIYLAALSAGLFAARLSFDRAQLLAASIAMTANFFLNNAITFRGRRLKGWGIVRGLLTFYLACTAGMWINLKIADSAGAAGANWWAAGLLGLGAGSIWNYGVSQLFTWRAGRKRQAAQARGYAAHVQSKD